MNTIEHTVSPELMEQLAEKIEAETGLSFPAAKQRDLGNAVRRMAESKGFDHGDACIDWLLRGRWDKEKTDLCAHHLTIGETYFFREPRAFDLVCGYARKKLKDTGSTNMQLRIWSAGCCTGEEPYSIAMALRHGVPDLEPRRTSILATDINVRHLQFARAGVYRQWSFRNTHAAMQKLDFSEEGENQFRIHDRIRGQVKFEELNLALPLYPSVATNTREMDIIFCRNVLMYFSRHQMKKVIERFRQCLVDGGWLIVSPSEASSELFAGFSGVYYPDAIYFRKTGHSDASGPKLYVVPSAPSDSQSCKVPEGIQSGSDSPDKLAYAKTRLPGSKRSGAENREEKRKTGENTHAVEAGADAVKRAHALANEGDIAEAMRCLEQAIKTGPATVELFHAKALIAMESGDHRDAMQSLKRVIYLDPDFVLAHYLMGVLQSAQNRHTDAVRQFKTAGELLDAMDEGDLVPGSDGLSTAYLRDSVRSYLQKSSL